VAADGFALAAVAAGRHALRSATDRAPGTKWLTSNVRQALYHNLPAAAMTARPPYPHYFEMAARRTRDETRGCFLPLRSTSRSHETKSWWQAGRHPISVAEPHFPVFDEFRGASYAKRYEILLTKMLRERLYDAACLLLSPSRAARSGAFSEPCPELTFANFAESLVARALAYARTQK
jgi:hypothetical protein